MAENSPLVALPGILFANDRAEKLNEIVRTKIDSSLFLFLNYTPNIINPYSYDGKYLMGVSNLYKLIKDTGWVLEKSGKILGSESVVGNLKSCINTIYALRAVQNHNIWNDYNLPELYKAEKWWYQAGVISQRPVSEDDYQKALTGLEALGSSLIKEVEDFVDNVSKLNSHKKEKAIEIWTDAIIVRYTKERNLFTHAIVLYQKYSPATNIDKRKKVDDIIVSYFINDYYCLRYKEYNGIILYSKPIYKKSVDTYIDSKLNKFKKDYGLDIVNIADLINDIKNDKEKYLNLFFEHILGGLIKEALVQKGSLEIDTVCEYILKKMKQ